ncbi:N-acetyl-alpha-D-glucosaminyl L-malate synthase [Flavobacteriaceae bacterium UJ101]|nr:N-acetyl-alpha-D-glucosaminyl L-malate synthase [Flavobacteriaceae bacterium UJ101]
MKIGIVCYPTFGGSGIVATELGMELAKQGNEVHFISYSEPARLNVLMPNITFHPVEIENYPLFQYQPYSLALSTLMVDIVKQHGLDVIHVHYAIPHAYAAFIAKQILKEDGIELPVVTTLHGTDITLVGKHPSYKSAVEFSINQSDIVTSVSQSLKQNTLDVFKIKKEIHVIPNFIESELFDHLKQNCPRENFATEDEKLLVHVSNFREVKNVPHVVEVFHLVQKKIKAKLLLIGVGPEREKVELLVRKLGLEDQVFFLGKIRQLYQILCACDLFVLPSSQESFGLAALEAMAASLPVISSNAGGIPEVNVEGVTGYLSNIGDIEEMAENAIELLSNEEKLKEFKENAKAYSFKFRKEKILPMYMNLYEQAIKKD